MTKIVRFFETKLTTLLQTKTSKIRVEWVFGKNCKGLGKVKIIRNGKGRYDKICVWDGRKRREFWMGWGLD